MYIDVIKKLVKANNKCPYLSQNGACGQRGNIVVCVGDCHNNCPNKEYAQTLLSNYSDLDLLF